MVCVAAPDRPAAVAVALAVVADALKGRGSGPVAQPVSGPVPAVVRRLRTSSAGAGRGSRRR
jgi:hypothetical protein